MKNNIFAVAAMATLAIPLMAFSATTSHHQWWLITPSMGTYRCMQFPGSVMSTPNAFVRFINKSKSENGHGAKATKVENIPGNGQEVLVTGSLLNKPIANFFYSTKSSCNWMMRDEFKHGILKNYLP